MKRLPVVFHPSVAVSLEKLSQHLVVRYGCQQASQILADIQVACAQLPDVSTFGNRHYEACHGLRSMTVRNHTGRAAIFYRPSKKFLTVVRIGFADQGWINVPRLELAKLITERPDRRDGRYQKRYTRPKRVP